MNAIHKDPNIKQTPPALTNCPCSPLALAQHSNTSPDVTAVASPPTPASTPNPSSTPASTPNQAITHEDARQLVQHPMLGCSHAFQMLLGAAGLQDGTC